MSTNTITKVPTLAERFAALAQHAEGKLFLATFGTDIAKWEGMMEAYLAAAEIAADYEARTPARTRDDRCIYVGRTPACTTCGEAWDCMAGVCYCPPKTREARCVECPAAERCTVPEATA